MKAGQWRGEDAQARRGDRRERLSSGLVDGRESRCAGHGAFAAAMALVGGAFIGTMAHVRCRCWGVMAGSGRGRGHTERHHQDRGDQEEFGKRFAHRRVIRLRGARHNGPTRHIAPIMVAIHSAMPTIIRFSVSEIKPRGTLLDPPTHAHLSSRLSI